MVTRISEPSTAMIPIVLNSLNFCSKICVPKADELVQYFLADLKSQLDCFWLGSCFLFLRLQLYQCYLCQPFFWKCCPYMNCMFFQENQHLPPETTTHVFFLEGCFCLFMFCRCVVCGRCKMPLKRNIYFKRREIEGRVISGSKVRSWLRQPGNWNLR